MPLVVWYDHNMLSPVQMPMESIVLANDGIIVNPLPLYYHNLLVLLMCLCMSAVLAVPAISALSHTIDKLSSCRLHYLPLSESLLYYHNLLCL